MNPQDHAQPQHASPGSIAPALISIKQVALMLNVDERTIYRRVKAGDMPAPVKIGHLTRWRLEELQRWCDAGCPPVDKSKGGGR